MARPASQSGLTDDLPELAPILVGTHEPLAPPIRSEVFGQLRFAQHGDSLAQTHRAEVRRRSRTDVYARLRDNRQALRAAYDELARFAESGYQVSPAAEWLLDNFHLIDAQYSEVCGSLPPAALRDLPRLIDEPLAGLPRVYGVAWAFVAHTDSAFNEELLTTYLSAYQAQRELGLSEVWALPATLRIVLIENLRRLAERSAAFKAAREVANRCSDRLERYSPQQLDALRAQLAPRGVARVFLAQLAQRLTERAEPPSAPYLEWIGQVLPDAAAARAQAITDQAADNLSVSNAVRALRAIGEADWPQIVAASTALMRLLLAAPSFVAEHPSTRDRNLHLIERLARRSGRGEVAVGEVLRALMEAHPLSAPQAYAGYWLHGAGRGELLRQLGVRAPVDAAALRARLALPVYLTVLLVGTAWLMAWLLPPRTGLGSIEWLLAASLLAFPASEAVIAIVHRLISESVPPARLPRLALVDGIGADDGVLVVIPALLTDTATADELAHRLLLHHLANPQCHVQFALATDWADAPAASLPTDALLLSAAAERLRALNARYPAPPGQPPRFLLLHRPRRYSESEQGWIGWERKRGKLETLIAALATGRPHGFVDLQELSRLAPATRYLLTLDSDTRLPPGRLCELVSIAAHPVNRPRLDASGRRVIDGFGILQPRMVTPLPQAREQTPYHWLFAGQQGIDPYSVPSSEIYQDVFGAGTYVGKGLLDVAAVHAVLGGRLPDERVLSHDLLEGALARCAVTTEVTLLEPAPFHADVAAARLHRWIRGDWQLLPFLLQPRRYPMAAVDRWKMFDNLRRSLVAPATLLLILLAAGGYGLTLGAALGITLAASSAGAVLGAIAGFFPGGGDLAWRRFLREALVELLRAVGGGLWLLAMLLVQALLAADAVLRALWRLGVSRRHLLQWTTAAAVQAGATTEVRRLWRRHARVPAVGLLFAVFLVPFALWPKALLLLCLLWASAPLLIAWISRPLVLHRGRRLSLAERSALHAIARDTWRLFERCVTAADRHLPPDNLQLEPQEALARRTSPTNIGLYLLSAACARRFGWIGTEDLLARLEATLASLATLERERGHFLNWYDTATGAALTPRYVSTVDSGNLSAHLLAVAQACHELAVAPYDDGAAQRAVQRSLRRLVAAQAPRNDPPWAMLLQDDALRLAAREPARFMQHLEAADQALAAQRMAVATAISTTVSTTGSAAADPLADPLADLLGDHLTTLRSALRDLTARAQAAAATQASQRLQALAAQCERLAWAPQFDFLYHRKRQLFHIGWRVNEQQLDGSYYDLLASEARLASLLAIAKGEVSVGHWTALGRPFFASGLDAGLRSWSGSMFEYLMPTLLVEEPQGSALADATHTAVAEQIAYGQQHHVPWGVSESAYAGRDHTLAYQYAPQGVPRLALRRTPLDDLVIAPYATALAAPLAPRRALENFKQLERLGARGRYGFMEALDYSAQRRGGAHAPERVATYMAHHQGMTIAALANLLLDRQVQRWAAAEPHFEAVVALLHERTPRAVPPLAALPAERPRPAAGPRSPALLQHLRPTASGLLPTHLLSNGRYSVALRANGAGWSRWRKLGISRQRDDVLRDGCGTFLFLRRTPQAEPVSLTLHPAPDPQAQYRATHHNDRVCLEAHWPELHARTTVWVSPEDDIEFRQVELRNCGDQELTLELSIAFEATLAEPRADAAHPAFSNLFVQAHWQAEDRALLLRRRPRLAGEPTLGAALFLAAAEPEVDEVLIQTDRRHWLGRNAAAGRILAQCAAPPPSTGGPVPLTTGLDPVAALAVRLRLAPHASMQLTFAIAAAEQDEVLNAVIDKYRSPSHIQRSALMSATLAGIRLHEMRLDAENAAALQWLTTLLDQTLTRAPALRMQDGAGDTPDTPDGCDRRLLWRFGISGDLPIVLVTAGAPSGLGLLRTLAQALRVWSWAQFPCDLVVIDTEPASYDALVQREVGALRDRVTADNAAQGGAVLGLHLLRAGELTAAEVTTLHTLARVHLPADGRPLALHLQALATLHERDFEERRTGATAPVPSLAPQPVIPAAGRFADDGAAFEFNVQPHQRPLRPWINVLANPGFGAQVSEAGGGYTWAVNSRLNQLTPWSNDPVADAPSEWLLLQDLRSGQIWSATPSAWADPQAIYRVTHRQGTTEIHHRHGELDVTVQWCVDADTAVKQLRLQLHNLGSRSLTLRPVMLAEWQLGAGRGDRLTVQTAQHRRLLRGAAAPARRLIALFATQRERSAGFGQGTAFLALAEEAGQSSDWTCDRREFFDAAGQLVLPDYLGQRRGRGLDPCAALSTRLTLGAGAQTEVCFLLGHAADPAAAQSLAEAAAAELPGERVQRVQRHWDRLLGAAVVHTPDPAFDALVNRWLLYQAVGCRLWAKAGFYQAGGASGFRDQLQDSLALAWAAPEQLRAQIVACAQRQFVEGDVQHWWHAPTGVGVRTRISDDRLWLTAACVHYLRATGDAALLDEPLPFLESLPIAEGAEDRYETPQISAHQAPVYEHAALALDCSLAVGVHGLPLIGTGDWNDGMNRVGHEGRGESVWLGWFLHRQLTDFAPIARARGDVARAQRWEDAALRLYAALDTAGWDGAWFRRAYFDDGTPLGSASNTEAKIDLIAQAWAVLSQAAAPDKQRAALAAAEAHLVDRDAGLIRLLDPPLAQMQPDAGYIQAYPPGVRENGGQYSHAAVWALLAQAALGTETGAGDRVDSADGAWRYFTYLSPAHRAADPVHGPRYEIEPYVMAGDIYSQPPYVGRGGWSWYTGSAAWMYRAALEALLGLQLEADSLHFRPCLPPHWPRAELRLTRGELQMRFVLVRATAAQARPMAELEHAALLLPGERLRWTALVGHPSFVVPILGVPAA
jgi:cyclic beta-1,2-glucan synthetase